MARFGYTRYGVQGSDIGAAVSPKVGRIAPDRVVGVHTNGGPGPMPHVPLDDETSAALSDLERDRVARIEQFMLREFGYISIQSTRPLTLAFGLVDSPGRSARLDRRQVPRVDAPGGCRSAGRDRRRHPADERDALLAHRHGR